MKKINGIPFVVVSIVIQLIAIPLLNSMLYSLASLFHEKHVRTSTSDGMDFYGFALIFVTISVIIFVLLTTILQEFFKNEGLITLLHASWLSYLINATWGDLMYRPYEYGLLLFCIVLTIPIRILVRKTLHT
ncbi:MAG: hypothetical protein ACO1N0_19195 [Fluviicola sp.]